MSPGEILITLGVFAGCGAIFLYFRSVDALEKQRRRQARADEYAQAQRRITHGGRSNANP